MSQEYEYVIVSLCEPGQPERAIGVILLDPANRSLHTRFRREIETQDPRTAEMAVAVVQEMQEHASRDGERYLRYLEDVAANAIQLSERSTIRASDIETAMDLAFDSQ